MRINRNQKEFIKYMIILYNYYIQQELDLLTQETQLNATKRIVVSSLSSLASEERDIINHIQLLTERVTQLENSFTSSQAAIEEVSHQIEQLQQELQNPGVSLSLEELETLKQQYQETEQKYHSIHNQYEDLQYQQIQATNRINLIRKELVC